MPVSLVKEFKEFAIKGNAVDMAVGLIVGAAFGKIVTSMVSDVIMPPVGMLLGGVDFSKLQITMKEAKIDPVTKAVLDPGVALRYGAFVNTCIDFMIVAFCVFMMVKLVNSARASGAEKPKS